MRPILAAAALLVWTAGAEAAAPGHGLRFAGASRPAAAPHPADAPAVALPVQAPASAER